MKRAFAAALIILMAAACSPQRYTCTDPLGCLEIPTGSPVVIGLLYTSIGPDSSTGLETLKQVEQAITDKGSLLGHPVDLVHEGSDCTSDGLREAAIRLTLTPDLLAVIIPTCDADTEKAVPVLEDAGFSILRPAPFDVYKAVDYLFTAIEKTAIHSQGRTLYIPRTGLREALDNFGDHP